MFRLFVCISPFDYVCVNHALLVLQNAKQKREVTIGAEVELAVQNRSLEKKMREVGEYANVKLYR